MTLKMTLNQRTGVDRRTILVSLKTSQETSGKGKLGVKHGVKHNQRAGVNKKSYIGEPQNNSSNQHEGETMNQTKGNTWVKLTQRTGVDKNHDGCDTQEKSSNYQEREVRGECNRHRGQNVEKRSQSYGSNTTES